MAKMVNVNREVQDSFYRYKMPMVEAKIEGRGNGIKTVIPNMVDIAKALGRPPAYPTKYLGVELGAQTQMQVEAERYIVNGSFSADRFQELLDGFIKKFVLCPECGNPETKLRVTKKKEIESSCRACGHRCFLPLSHRLTTYIINNPPDGSGAAGKSGKMTKEERRKAKNARMNADANNNNDNNNNLDRKDSEGDASTSQSVEAGLSAASRDNVAMREGGAALHAPAAVTDSKDEDEEWSVDTSEEAVRARTAALGTGVTSLTLTDDLEKPMGERLNIFADYVTDKLKLPKFPAKEVIGEAERLDCKEKGVMVLVELLLTDGDVFDKIKKYNGLFQRFTIENAKCQKYMLGAIEKLVEAKIDLLPKVARLFKDLYDKDIVDEEVFVAWGEKASKKYVSKELSQKIHDKAQPFISWLKEAESESDEDDAVVDFVTPGTQPVEEAAAPAEAAAEEEDDDDDIDIDDI